MKIKKSNFKYVSKHIDFNLNKTTIKSTIYHGKQYNLSSPYPLPTYKRPSTIAGDEIKPFP